MLYRDRKRRDIMADVFDVASYILSKCGDMSAMKLQKLCYYAQAWSTVWDERPLFPEEFEAWKNGPVCPALFFRTQGQLIITEKDGNGNPDNLTPSQKEIVDAVLEYYGDKDAQWLSRLAQMEKPWELARKGYGEDECRTNVISLESMSEYYSSILLQKQAKIYLLNIYMIYINHMNKISTDGQKDL